MQFILFLSLCIISAADLPIWPIPYHQTFSGQPLPLCKTFEITCKSTSPILQDAIIRYSAVIGQGSETDSCLAELKINVKSDSEDLGVSTDVSYNVFVDSFNGQLSAATIYGAMYALESFSQLVEKSVVLYTNIRVYDYPEFNHRGILMDTGRRFWPVKTAKMLIDGMSHVKMNVLHMHLSEQARVAVESKRYPGLTKLLVGNHTGHYKQSEVVEIVRYAKSRGVRVIPEIDLPGHASCYRGLIDDGIQFCSDRKYQLYDDPENRTYTIITNLLEEIFSLFPEPFAHLGCDETAITGKCTKENTKNFENKIFKYVLNTLHKRPIAWEEAKYSVGSEIPELIIDTWLGHGNQELRHLGFDAIESQMNNFYIWAPQQPYTALWANVSHCHGPPFDPMPNTTLYGGEVSMWGDNYCWAYACGEIPGTVPPGAPLYPPQMNEIFHESVLSEVFPRATIGAGSFWRYNPDLIPEGPEILNYYHHINNQLNKFGVMSCPDDCYCDELTKCGKPYF